MSNSVDEFLSKKGIKKFKNGVQAFMQKQAVKAAAVSMVLASAFAGPALAQKMQPRDSGRVVTSYAVTEKGDTLCSYQAVQKDSASFARLEKLVNNATKSRTGREILRQVSEQGTILYVDFAGNGTVGFFDPSNNSICLNPSFNDGNLQSCLIHEGKHSIQSAALNKGADYAYDYASNVMTSRVMEADAMATQTKFSYEMAQAGDSLAWKELATGFPHVTKAFEKGVDAHGENSKKTMKATMLAWYQNKNYVKCYDAKMANFHARFVVAAPDSLMKNAFQKTMSADFLVRQVCTMDGKPYAGRDGSILKTPQTAYLSSDVHEFASLISNAVQTRVGRRDDSADSFYTFDINGNVSKKTYAQRKAEKAKAAKSMKMAKGQDLPMFADTPQMAPGRAAEVNAVKSGASLYSKISRASRGPAFVVAAAAKKKNSR